MKQEKFIKIILFAFFCYAKLASAKIENEEEIQEPPAPPAVGNFSLPLSFQPGPLISFGENILNRGDLQLSLYSSSYIGINNFYNALAPSLLYGITDDFSVMISIPFAPVNQGVGDRSTGFQDLFLQFEYALINYNTRTGNNLGTVVANVTFPTGSYKKNPPLGIGSYTFFLGGTYNHTGIDWFVFLSSGIQFMTNWTGHNVSGNQFFYEFGFGRTIMSSPRWIFAWVAEFDGIYTKKMTQPATTSANTSIINTQAVNSGGNMIYFTPSLSFSFPKYVIQFGVGYPFVQTVNEGQVKQFMSVNASFVFAFS